MNCPQCGNDIPSGEAACPHCQALLTPDDYRMNNAAPPATHGLAIAALVLGLLGFCVPLFAPLFGLFLGIGALIVIHAHPGRWKGSGLAIAGIAFSVIGFLLFPFGIFWGHEDREKPRLTTCLSQVRQLAIAAQMYDQDNKACYPGTRGTNWDLALGAYLGNTASMFTCPSDSSANSNINSYGYSGMMVYANGSGVNESVITAPNEVGVVCDASPSMAYGSGGLVGGGALAPMASTAVIPAPRHSNGTVVGYADGHAIYCPNGYNAKDISNNVTRAFYLVNALGLINNPGGGLCSFNLASLGSGHTAYNNTPLTIGGDLATMPILTAAAEAWKKATGARYSSKGFLGMGKTTGRKADFVWGCADGQGGVTSVSPQNGNNYFLGVDALVFIVSKNTRIDRKYFSGPISSGTYSATTADIMKLLDYYDPTLGKYTGYSANAIQAYGYDSGFNLAPGRKLKAAQVSAFMNGNSRFLYTA